MKINRVAPLGLARENVSQNLPGKQFLVARNWRKHFA
jgi:hypothetical protein